VWVITDFQITTALKGERLSLSSSRLRECHMTAKWSGQVMATVALETFMEGSLHPLCCALRDYRLCHKTFKHNPRRKELFFRERSTSSKVTWPPRVTQPVVRSHCLVLPWSVSHQA
jgi:hypothetical protein